MMNITKEMGSKNRGYAYPRTLFSPIEKALADKWEKENEERPNINYGHGILQDLFMDPTKYGHRFAECVHPVDDNERYVAATVVQWLGTPVGLSFLREALKEAGMEIIESRNEP